MSNFTDNLILNTDSYKLSHYKLLEPKTENIFSYSESRGGDSPETVFFGLQYALKKHLTTPITASMIDQAGWFIKQHGLPFNHSGWEYILHHHGGRLPLRIRAVPEGAAIPTNNVLMTIENTDPKVPWVGPYFETELLRAVWYGTTVATRSFEYKKKVAPL